MKGVRFLRPVFLLVFASLAFVAGQAQAATPCGGDGQRACCVASTERANGACHSGNAEIPGCTGVGDCKCGGSGLAVLFGSSSSSRCEERTPCGGEGERACCITVGESRWNDNPVPFSGGCSGAPGGGVNNLTEIALSGGVQGGYCGGDNPFGWRSNGTCVLCGTKGARECVGVSEENKCRDDTGEDLVSVAGWCQSCGGEGQILCENGMCGVGLHPNGGYCTSDTVIAEPDCDCEVDDTLSTDPQDPVVGYADMHLHLFSNLAFGGLMVWGEAFHPEGGISQALRADNFAQRTLRHEINGHAVKGVNGDEVAEDLFRQQTMVHGDGHSFLDAPVSHGTGEGDTANGGVEWDPEYILAENNAHFTGWPKWNSTTHQQAYYRWLERAHKGGLQLVVMLAVNNEAMCASARRLDYPEFDCADTMAAVRLQLQAAKDMEEWLNRECSIGNSHACAKRPGTQEGWFKIVYSPEEARLAIARGQMAAVLGIEESFLFDCRPGSDTCDAKYVQQELDKYHEVGVRHIFPLHNFDNAFGGTATWQDTITIANRYSTGSWFTTRECPEFEPYTCLGEEGCAAKYGFDFTDVFGVAGSDPFSLAFWESLGNYLMAHLTGAFGFGESDLDAALNTMPFDNDTTCNTKGLSPLGNFLNREMMARGMIIDIDHMSSFAVDQTLSQAEAEGYPGIVASHVLMLDLTEESTRHERMRSAAELQRIAALGGMIGVMTQPPAGEIIQPENSRINNVCPESSMTWGQMYEYAVEVMTTPEGVTPVAFGTDFNGISAHNGPRNGCGGDGIVYPFTLEGFGTFYEQETGGRNFNFNTAGLAHVGLLPDMVQDLKTVGLSNADLDPLFSSAEKYISMWEAAIEVSEGIEPADGDDLDAPLLELRLTKAPNAEGWHKESFSIELSASDTNGLSRIDHTTISQNPSVVSVESEEVSIPVNSYELQSDFAAVAYDLAGNNSEYKTLEIKIDQVVPTITASHSPLSNTAGWINQPVTVVYECDDALSGVLQCPAPQVLGSDGAGQSTSGVVSDLAGNEAQDGVDGINIDQTSPVVQVSGVEEGSEYWLGQVPTAGCVTTDALSGVAQDAVLEISGGTANNVGLYIAACSGAVDVADNTNSLTSSYWVRYIFDGFYSPVKNPPTVNKVKAGSAVPIKFSLDGEHGLDILSADSPRSSLVNCSSGAAVNDIEEEETATSGSSTLSYSGDSDQYSYVWKTNKFWSGTCRKFLLKLDDGSTHSALFEFK